jgi:hypothetical protein
MTEEQLEAKKKNAGEKVVSMKRRDDCHDYKERRMYMITLEVEGRLPVFGHLEGDAFAEKGSKDEPRVVLSELGKAVEAEWFAIPRFFPQIEVRALQMMPDHMHGIIFIKEKMEKDLSRIIRGFKTGCGRSYRELFPDAAVPAVSAVPAVPTVPAVPAVPAVPYVATQSRQTQQGQRPKEDRTHGLLFARGFNDKLLLRRGQLDNWLHYLSDNPRRLLMRREYPGLFQRALCIKIDGVRYSAFGNMLLLRLPDKQQVFFHRRTDGIPTENTPYWDEKRQQLTADAKGGCVLVTPGISECEKRMKHIALDERLPLIHVQTEPITDYWKPERSRFEACAAGTLLILAPWAEDMPVFKSDYERFHYLNRLAEEICAIGHTTKVVIQGIGRKHGK